MNATTEATTPAKTSTEEHAYRVTELRTMSAIARAAILAYQRLVTVAVNAALVQLDAIDEYIRTGEAPPEWEAHWERDDALTVPLQPTAIGFVSELLHPVTWQGVALAFGGLPQIDARVTPLSMLKRATIEARTVAPAKFTELMNAVVSAIDTVETAAPSSPAHPAASSDVTDIEIEEKARRKYFRDNRGVPGSLDQPGDITVDRVSSRVVLSNCNGTLATYAFKVDGGGRVSFTEVEND